MPVSAFAPYPNHFKVTQDCYSWNTADKERYYQEACWFDICSPLSSGFPALLCNSQGLTGFGTLSLFGQAASDQLAQDSGLSLFHLLALHQPLDSGTERC